MRVRESHCVKECSYGGCEQLYDVSNSDAQSTGKYCSAECEELDAEGHAIAREDRVGYYTAPRTA